MGAWIEILARRISSLFLLSLPLWERGLKYNQHYLYYKKHGVAPLVGAWIEIACISACVTLLVVAPLVGAWIEMKIVCSAQYRKVVAPLVGAWIEIKLR